MASDAEIDFVEAAVNWLRLERPEGLPETASRKGNEGTAIIKILAEADLDPKQRPCVVVISEGSIRPHPKIAQFSISVDLSYPLDDFDEGTVRGWARAVAAVFEDSFLVATKVQDQLEQLGSRWKIRDIRPGSGSAEDEGRRSRMLSDSWRVWMVRG